MRRTVSVLLGVFFVSSLGWAQSAEPDKVLHASRVGRTAAPLRDLATPIPAYEQLRTRDIPNRQSIYLGEGSGASILDPVLQNKQGPRPLGPPIQNFDGNTTGSNPPDTNGEAGPNHYFQTVNVVFSIYDKTGTRLVGPSGNNVVFAGFGGPCEFTNRGDPIVLYDQIADRWLLSQFTAPGAGSATQCVAVSETPDPTGDYFLYEFPTPGNDYPKLSVWTDGGGQSSYLAGIRNFSGGFNFDAYAFERDEMLTNGTPEAVVFNLSALVPGANNFLPADVSGPTLPPAGTPVPWVGMDNPSVPQNELEMLELEVDWGTPANSTLTRLADVPVAQFDGNVCFFNRSCIPQPNTNVRVDGFADAMMFRLPYRNFGTSQSIVCTHTVDVGDFPDHAGIRWHELTNAGATNGTWALRQEGTYSPDSDHRWMPSIEINGVGDIMVGYSVSSKTTFPSVRVAGRQAGDPLNQLTFAEGLIVPGLGSQTSSTRWGDYSDMTVDPSDDFTFWYTEQYQAQHGGPKNTRIASIAPNTAPPLVDITVTPQLGDPVIVPLSDIRDAAFPIDYDVKVDNNGTQTLNTQIWNTLTLFGSGREVGPVQFTVMDISVPAGGSFTQTFRLSFLQNEPFNTVVLNMKVGEFPNVQLDRDTFEIIRANAPNRRGADRRGVER